MSIWTFFAAFKFANFSLSQKYIARKTTLVYSISRTTLPACLHPVDTLHARDLLERERETERQRERERERDRKRERQKERERGLLYQYIFIL